MSPEDANVVLRKDETPFWEDESLKQNKGSKNTRWKEWSRLCVPINTMFKAYGVKDELEEKLSPLNNRSPLKLIWEKDRSVWRKIKST